MHFPLPDFIVFKQVFTISISHTAVIRFILLQRYVAYLQSSGKILLRIDIKIGKVHDRGFLMLRSCHLKFRTHMIIGIGATADIGFYEYRAVTAFNNAQKRNIILF